jgi:hypothetical protein
LILHRVLVVPLVLHVPFLGWKNIGTNLPVN